VITVAGGDETVECGDMYVAPLATADDACVGAVPVDVVNPVDTGAPGVYTVVYTATDGVNTATAQVQVTVVDTVPPVITVAGGDETVECGDMYVAPLATADDACVGAIIVDVTDNVNTNVPGTYAVTFTASDGTNVATEQITVAVVDTTAPIITVVNGDETIECGSEYVVSDATAFDACIGIVPIEVDNAVNAGATGVYTVTFTATDGTNTAVEQVTVTVEDSIAPVITIAGSDETIECGSVYEPPVATADDACLGSVPVVVDNTVDTNAPGMYTVSYTATDGANEANEMLTITVEDTVAPVITLEGDAEVTLELCSDDVVPDLPGAMADDSCDGDLTAAIIVGGDTVSTTPGVYVVTYSVTDMAGNNAVEVRTVTVQVPAGVNIVLAETQMTLECRDVFETPTGEVRNACDEPFDVVAATGTVDTMVVGEYILTYSYAGAADATLIVTVADTIAPVIALVGEATVTIDCGGSYTDAGAIATDDCEGDLTQAIAVGGDTVDTSVPGVYTLTYNVADASTNNAEEVVRTVTVLDNCVEGEGEPVEGEGEPVEGEGEPVEGEGEPVEGEGEPVEGEGEPVEGEGEPVEGEGEPVEGEGEPVEGEPVEGEGEPVEGEGEPVEGEGEPVEGEGEPVEGEGEPVEGEGEPVEGEGEPVEGEPVEGEGEPVEGEPVEGEGEIPVDDIIDNFDGLDTDGDGLLTCGEVGTLTNDQCAALDTDGDGFISYGELVAISGGECKATLTVQEEVQIECSDYAVAQAAVTDAFESVRADNGCRVDLTDSVRVKQIAWVKPNGNYELLNLEEIAASIKDFEDGEYDYSIAKTRKLFHYYFLFKPGDYDITWEIVVDGEPLDNYEASALQWIRVDNSCKGCLGCNSSCAGCRDRYIPADAANLKQLLSDWLLIGLSVLVLLSWSVVNKQ